MGKDDNKWTRERGFWERNGAEIGILTMCGFFLVMMVLGTVFVLTKPEIPGLSTMFKAPPPPPPKPSYDQKFRYSVPGETEVLLFPGKPVKLPPPPPEKPPAPAQKP